MESEQLVGTWKPVSFELRSSSGEVTYPYGRDPFGMLIYDSTGNMSVLLMRRDRPEFASNDPLGGTPDEIKAAFEGFAAYGGTYEVNEEKGTVTHPVECSWFPNWAGADQVRFFELSGDQLLLTSPPILAGDEQRTIHAIFNRSD